MTKPSARERLLTAADELFYAEGVQSVGIDRVIERAGVAKASLYQAFKSKDALVGAYLAGRSERSMSRIAAGVARHDAPRDRLLAVIEVQAAWMTRAEFTGCPFAAAAAEAKPDTAAAHQVSRYRSGLRALLTELATEVGVPDPALLARQLHQLYDGAAQAVHLGDDREAAAAAVRSSATTLVDQAISAA